MGLVILVVLILLIVGSLPTWGYSRGWNAGYYPAGGLGLLFVILLILILLGHVPFGY